ncbi:Hypothetical protein FKW44_025087 [Caligus rogercresseyi]|uniref:Uncharacterized protein n=1 Tax=Caligus rogercresseyi TaxID=217165 RepID=A0A7T8GKU6_CALRO|nr:Hypothetical protein FKW44_025087 [Caligus rogercresseyi]
MCPEELNDFSIDILLWKLTIERPYSSQSQERPNRPGRTKDLRLVWSRGQNAFMLWKK